jgi:cell cycle sensor histidine kinase DivJ
MRFINPLYRQSGIIAHLTWIVALAGVAPLIIAATPVSTPIVLAGIAAAMAPGFAGLFLARRKTPVFGKMVLSLLWVSFAASVAAVSGGLTGPAALLFLLPAAAAASSGNRKTVTEAAALSGLTALLVGGLQFGGFFSTYSLGLDIFAPAFLAVGCFIAACFTFSALISLRSRRRLKSVAAKHRLRSRAFDNAPVALIVESNGKILARSRSLKTLVPGLPPEMTGLPICDLGFDAEASTAFQFAHGQTSAQSRIRGAKGRAVDVDLYRSSTGVVAIIPPTTRNDVIAASDEQLQQERDEALAETHAKSEFLASVSHEIRTPLNAIIGFSDAMKSRLFGPVPSKYAEYAELIHESGRHLLELIGDVLDLSKIEADSYELSQEEFNASDVVELCVRMLSQRAEEAGVVIELDVDTTLPVMADRRAMRQILLNLLSNAIKFTPKAGVIVVMAHRSREELVLGVGDSGPGIPAEELSQLGQRYMQATTAKTSSERGSGLGLSLVKALAEMHGGEMSIDSTLGEGTTVSVNLPIMAHSADTDMTDDETLEIHARIERAQAASQTLASSG